MMILVLKDNGVARRLERSEGVRATIVLSIQGTVEYNRTKYNTNNES